MLKTANRPPTTKPSTSHLAVGKPESESITDRRGGPPGSNGNFAPHQNFNT
ncbi:hypothetical protein J6590_019305 [Homalodisca vitripennis]|nr:hypothetical protein J6590_019305 [Homalodisca vitripennis]